MTFDHVSGATLYCEPSSPWMKELLPSNSEDTLRRKQQDVLVLLPRTEAPAALVRALYVFKSGQVIGKISTKSSKSNKSGEPVALCGLLYLPPVWQQRSVHLLPPLVLLEKIF